MMPCKFCSLILANGQPARGIKQVGKTRYVGSRYYRRYRCQDCGALCEMSGEVGPRVVEEWRPAEGQAGGGATCN
jgi:hypothetical protein